MPALSDHQSSVTTKMLLIGDSGAGKSGSLASLASAGYNLRVLDLDNGLDALANILKDPRAGYAKDSINKVSYVTLTDPMKNLNGKLVPRKATVWTRAMDLLTNWKTETEDFGPISSWTPQEVLVIDSLSMLATSALNWILSMNARLGQQPHQSDWYAGQQLLESFFQTLFDESIKCNIVMNCHITYIGEENGPQRGYPATLGKALSPKMGSYFNSILMAKSVGSGSNAKHKIITKSQGMIELKNTNPLAVQPEYPLETGLADYFKAVRSVPSASPPPTPPAVTVS